MSKQNKKNQSWKQEKQLFTDKGTPKILTSDFYQKQWRWENKMWNGRWKLACINNIIMCQSIRKM